MASFLLQLMGLDALGVSVPGAGLFTAPVVAFQKDKDLDASTMISLICSCLCSAMVVQRMVNFPFKSVLPVTETVSFPYISSHPISSIQSRALCVTGTGYKFSPPVVV